MSEKIHVLAQKILGKPTVEACDLEDIRNLVQRYPYFAPAQFLLLQKLKSEQHPDYPAQLQKSVLYYHNPLAFEYFINTERFYTDIDFTEPSREEVQESFIPAVEEEEAIISEEVKEEEVTTVPEVESEPGSSTMVNPENEALPAVEELPSAASELTLPENEALPVSEPTAIIENAPEEVVEPTPVSAPAPASTPALAFEPYHTVDYFASQGIRLSQEEMGKDKFGQQLKSFTEWLKTMKKLPARQPGLDASTEKKLDHLAEDSIHNPEVITEAMAEVWLKQGNREKAIETYNKLSLQNPSKKAYFADLIENLKRS